MAMYGQQSARASPGSYGDLNAFPKTAESVDEWLDAIKLVRAPNPCLHP